MTEAEQAIKDATTKLPQLRSFGMKSPGSKTDCSGFKVDGVQTAIEFLCQCRRALQPRMNSYRLKHSAERWGRTYVSNGELIVAAAFLDFKIKWTGDDPNVWIAVARKDVRRLDPRRD
jgi:hypothetical protein